MPPKVVVDFDQARMFFELPIETAAAKLGVCATTLKKVCRQNGTQTRVFARVEGLVLTARNRRNASMEFTKGGPGG
jgi:hypothetical protein